MLWVTPYVCYSPHGSDTNQLRLKLCWQTTKQNLCWQTPPMMLKPFSTLLSA